MICAACVIACATLGAQPDSVFISEILFNVPKGDEGDANQDGKRDAAGDEFVEIHNPTSEPIQLVGYTITSRLSTDDPESTNGVRFTFPKFELPPDETVVIFNGYKARIPGPVGTPVRGPNAPNDHFGNAWVFTMNTSRKFNTFANGGDFCLLTSGRGEKLDCVVWGSPDPGPPAGVRAEIVDKTPQGSVQRGAPDEPFHTHRDLDAQACSPGAVTDES